jgi:hypothetical protein
LGRLQVQNHTVSLTERENLLLMDRGQLAAGFRVSRFHQILKTRQVTVHPGGDDANRIPNIFHYPFRFIFHLKHYPRLGIIEPMKCHHPGILGATGIAPGNALIRDLVDDFSVPLLFITSNLGFPVQVPAICFYDLRDTLHKKGKVFKLAPFLIDILNGPIDFNAVFDARHTIATSLSIFFHWTAL